MSRLQIKLKVSGMTCEGCARAIERVLRAQDPQAVVAVDFATGRVEAKTAAPIAAVVRAIEAAGYGAAPA